MFFVTWMVGVCDQFMYRFALWVCVKCVLCCVCGINKYFNAAGVDGASSFDLALAMVKAHGGDFILTLSDPNPSPACPLLCKHSAGQCNSSP